MEHVKAGSVTGINVPEPYSRSIQVLYAPDVLGVDELTFSLVQIEAGGGTDYHVHDRPELIHIVAGVGHVVVDDFEFEVAAGDVLYIREGEWHRLSAPGPDQLHLATVFTPGVTAESNYSRCMAATADAEEQPAD